MSVRRLIVEADPGALNVTEFCRQHAVSTWFFWDLRRRVAREGPDALEARSRAAHWIANKTPPVVEDAIVAKRKQLIDAGLDAGPATIAFHLQNLEGVPSESTIWRILKARGFIVDDPTKAPKRLAAGSDVKILNVIDDHSRLLVASVALTTCTGAAALTAVAEAATVLGWPERILSDNAKAFRYTLAAALAELGVAASRSRPYHPQTNGKVCEDLSSASHRFGLTLAKV
jgi:transposase InsO family protein